MRKITIFSLLSAAILSQPYFSNAENTQQAPSQNTATQQTQTPTQQAKQQTSEATTQQTTQQPNQQNIQNQKNTTSAVNKEDQCTTLMPTILRKEPNFNSNSAIKQIKKGEKLEIISETKNFYKVKYDDAEGYITKGSCSKNNHAEEKPNNSKNKTKSKVKYITLSAPTSIKTLAKKYCMSPQQFITLNRLNKNTKMLEENKAYIVKDQCSTKITKTLDKIPAETIEKEVDKIVEEKKEEIKIKQPEEEKNIKTIETKADQMAKILEPFSKPIEIEDNEGYKTIRISLRDINVIECPAGINSIVYSKEKGLITKTEKKAVFVKVPPIIKEDPEKGTQKIEYKDEPRDLFIECGNKIYSFVLIPEDVPAQKIIIKGKTLTKKDDQENSEEQSNSSAYEKEIVSILKDIYLNGINSQYDYKKLQEDVKKYKEIDIVPLRVYFTGKFIIKEYSIIAKEPPIELSEASFIHLSKYPVAIMLSKPKLSIKGESSSLFIVEKTSEEQ